MTTASYLNNDMTTMRTTAYYLSNADDYCKLFK